MSEELTIERERPWARALLLDIDGVLLPWYPFNDEKTAGFQDWRKEEADFFSRWSAEQLAAISKAFSEPGDQIFWLTTWILHDMIPHFSSITGWGADFPQSTHLLGEAEAFRGRAESGWWKWNYVKAMADAGVGPFDGSFDEVVWVDDDHPDYMRFLRADGIDSLGVQISVVTPSDAAWSRSEIEKWNKPVRKSQPIGGWFA